MYYNHTIIFYLNDNFIKAEAHKIRKDDLISTESYTETDTDNDVIEMILQAFNCNVVLNKNTDNVLKIMHEYTQLGDD